MNNHIVHNEPLILFGTQTGTAEDLAEQLEESLVELGHQARCENMFDVDLATVKEYKTILVIVSTWGDGEPPDDAEGLYGEFQGIQSGTLKGHDFAVFGLGDTGYDQFCQCGIDFDKYLFLAGAERLTDRVDADIDYEDIFDEWKAKVTKLIHQKSQRVFLNS